MGRLFTNYFENFYNCCEAFHSNFNSILYTQISARPDIFVFVGIMKNIQKYKFIKLRSNHLNNHRSNIIEKEIFIRYTMTE